MKKLTLTSKIHRVRLKELIRQHAVKGKMLDIGANFYNAENYHVYFENVTTLNIAPQKGIRIDIIGDAYRLPFPDVSFDVILCTEVLEHLHSPWVAVEEMQRVLKPGGTLLLSTPFIMPLHEVPQDFFRYTPFGLNQLFARFKNVKLFPLSTTFQSWFILAQRIAYQSDWGNRKILKFLWLLLAKFGLVFERCVKVEFGDIERKVEVDQIMSSGYFVVAEK